MLEKMAETKSLWEYLQFTPKPIYIYGMGDGAEKIIAVLHQKSIPLAGIYASDDHVRGHSFCGFPVKRFDEVCAETQNNFISLLAFATQQEPLLSFLYQRNERCELYAPDVPVVKTDDSLFDIAYVTAHETELDEVYRRLADEQSRQVFLNVLNFKVSGKVNYLRAVSTGMEEVYTNLIRPTPQEYYVDLGAYNGDTICEFLQYASSAAYILALEPDQKNFKRLNKTLTQKSIGADCRNLGAWRCADLLYFQGGKGGRNSTLNKNGKTAVTVDSVDHLLEGKPATIIKFDVEGAEQQAIIGCEKTIANCKPRLMVSAYHKNEDLFALPLQILRINPDYRIFLRHHPYIPAWETNYYFI